MKKTFKLLLVPILALSFFIYSAEAEEEKFCKKRDGKIIERGGEQFCSFDGWGECPLLDYYNRTCKVNEIITDGETMCSYYGASPIAKYIPGRGQYWICDFGNNKMCEATALNSRDCPKGGIDTSNYEIEEAIYCIIGGNTYEEETGNCKLKRGYTVNAIDYMKLGEYANPIDKVNLCEKDYNPVCGEDSIEYTNYCFAEEAGIRYYKGKCLGKNLETKLDNAWYSKIDEKFADMAEHDKAYILEQVHNSAKEKSLITSNYLHSILYNYFSFKASIDLQDNYFEPYIRDNAMEVGVAYIGGPMYHDNNRIVDIKWIDYNTAWIIAEDDHFMTQNKARFIITDNGYNTESVGGYGGRSMGMGDGTSINYSEATPEFWPYLLDEDEYTRDYRTFTYYYVEDINKYFNLPNESEARKELMNNVYSLNFYKNKYWETVKDEKTDEVIMAKVGNYTITYKLYPKTENTEKWDYIYEHFIEYMRSFRFSVD